MYNSKSLPNAHKHTDKYINIKRNRTLSRHLSAYSHVYIHNTYNTRMFVCMHLLGDKRSTTRFCGGIRQFSRSVIAREVSQFYTQAIQVQRTTLLHPLSKYDFQTSATTRISIENTSIRNGLTFVGVVYIFFILFLKLL